MGEAYLTISISKCTMQMRYQCADTITAERRTHALHAHSVLQRTIGNIGRRILRWPRSKRGHGLLVKITFHAKPVSNNILYHALFSSKIHNSTINFEYSLWRHKTDGAAHHIR